MYSDTCSCALLAAIIVSMALHVASSVAIASIAIRDPNAVVVGSVVMLFAPMIVIATALNVNTLCLLCTYDGPGEDDMDV